MDLRWEQSALSSSSKHVEIVAVHRPLSVTGRRKKAPDDVSRIAPNDCHICD